MERSEGKVGMKVLFGRRNGEKTLGKIVKVNRKNFKVKTLESRGTKRDYQVGTEWSVPPVLCEPAPDAEPQPEPETIRGPGVAYRSTPKKRRTSYRSKRSQQDKEARARDRAEALAKKLEDGCDLSNPPTYITASRRYLDGTKLTKWGRETDGRRQKLYDAENECPRGIEFESIEEAQKYLDKIFDSAWFQRRFSNAKKPELVATWGRSSNHGRRGLNRIRLSESDHLCERILIHELVHALVPKPHAGHGRLYCAIYLDLVRHYMGEDVYTQLKAAYRKHNVKYHPRRTAKR